MIKTIFDTGDDYKIPANIDCALFSLIGNDCVIDSGDNFTLHRQSGLNYYFNAGCVAYVGGSFVHISERQNFTLPANTNNIYLCLRISPSTTGNKGSIQFLTSVNMQHGNVYEGETRDFLLYIINTGSSSITSEVDRRVIKKGGFEEVTTGTLSSGQTQITLSNAQIKSNSILSFYTSIYGVNPTSVTVNSGSVTLRFDSQSSSMTVGVKVEGEY